MVTTMYNNVGYACHQLHQRVGEEKHSVVGKPFFEKHDVKRVNLGENFKIIKKCRRKVECLIFQMLIIRHIRPTFNTQADSIRAKIFI